MQRAIRLLGLLCLTMALLACGAGAPALGEVPVEGTVMVEETPRSQPLVVTATPNAASAAPLRSTDPDIYLLASIGDAETLDPALNYEAAGADIIQNTYERLVTYAREDATTLVPMLATDFTISQDGLRYTFTIREGVPFHEGGMLTAEDVAYSFQRGLLQGGPSSPQLLLTEPLLGVGVYDVPELLDPALSGNPDALQAADPVALLNLCEQVQQAVVDNGDGTVTFTLAQPWAPFLSTLAGTWASILDKEWVIAQGGWDGSCETWQRFYGVTPENSPFTALVNGTGPYKLEHWTRGEEIVLVAHEGYWVTTETGPLWLDGPVGPPTIKRIVIRSVDEWGTRLAMLQAGDADQALVPRETSAQIDPLVGERCDYDATTLSFDCAPTQYPNAPLRLYQGAPDVSRTDAMFVFDINTMGGNPFIGSGQLDGEGIPPDFFSDIHVRRGFNYCFDWDAYIEDALSGEATKTVGPILPGMVGYNPDGPAYYYDPERCAEELAQAWEGKVAEVGFLLRIAYNTGGTTRQTIGEILQANLAAVDERYRVEVIGLAWPTFLSQMREQQLPLYIGGWHEDIHDPHNWVQPFLVGVYGEEQGFPDALQAQFQELVNQGVLTTDRAERQAIYEELTRLDYENAIAIRLAVPTVRHYEQRWVQGWYFNPSYPGFYYYALSKR